jgi:gluconolactonase
MYAAPPDIETRVFARVPEELSRIGHSSQWLSLQQRGRAMGSFIEGPSFDREGNLYIVDIPHGRVFRVSPGGDFDIVADYDGQPNGLKIHQDGRIFIADYANGIMELDPVNGRISDYLARERFPDFKGFNDLFFASNGDLYFTDQGYTGLHDPTGRLWRYTADGHLDCLLDNVPSPNGLVMAPDETQLFLAVTRANAVWRVPFLLDGTPSKVGTFIQMSGGAGPDGMAINERGELLVAHVGGAAVWQFSRLGEPMARIRSCAGPLTTNVAFGGPDNRRLYITESETGSILTADLETPGQTMFSHMD